MSLSAISSSTAAPYAIVRAANADRAAANAAAHQAKQQTESRVVELSAQAKANASEDRQAAVAHEEASRLQASTVAILNAYA